MTPEGTGALEIVETTEKTEGSVHKGTMSFSKCCPGRAVSDIPVETCASASCTGDCGE